jgi:carbon storage regulator
MAEQIRIGDEIVLTVLGMQGSRVRLGISAPRDIVIRRCELDSRPDSEHTAETIAAATSVRLPR